MGRGTSLPSIIAGVVESVTASCPTSCAPSRSIQSDTDSSAPQGNLPPTAVLTSMSKGSLVDCADPIIMRSRLACT